MLLPALILAALALPQGSAARDDSEGGLLTVRTFSSDDGLSRGWIYRIVVDSRGFIWFCAQGGLTRFDGHEFSNFGATVGLPETSVFDLVEFRDRTGYWIASEAGLYELRLDAAADGSVRAQRLNLPRAGPVRRLLLDSASRLWIGMQPGLLLLEPNAPQSVRELLPALARAAPDSSITALIEARDRSIWVGTHVAGLFRFRADLGAVRNYPASLRGANFIRDLIVGPDGRVWGSYFGGVARFRDDADDRSAVDSNPIDELFEVDRGLPSIDTAGLLSTASGEIFAATRAGVARIGRAAGGWSVRGSWRMKDGLPSEAALALAIDPAGSLWIGTLARGAMRLTTHGFHRYPQVEAEGAVLVGLETDPQGEVVALADLSHRGYRLFSLSDRAAQGTSLSLPRDIDYLGWGLSRLAIGLDGTLWVGTGKGLLRYPHAAVRAGDSFVGQPASRFDAHTGLAGDEVYWLARDRRGAIWVGTTLTRQGLSSLSRIDPRSGRIENYPESIAGRTPALATALAEDGEGNSWIGFGNGVLARFDAAGRSQPVEFDFSLPEHQIEQLYLDRRGRLWISNGSGPALQVECPPAARCTRRETLAPIADESVHCVIEDLAGQLYFGTDRGLVRVDPQSGASRLFTREDGLPGSTITRCLSDRSGRLWFGDYHGLVSLRPGEPQLERPIEALLSSLSIDGRTVAIPPLGSRKLGPIALEAGPHRLALRCLAIDYSPGQRVKFQYDIDDSGRWSDPSDSRSFEFALASSGTHRISLRTTSASVGSSPAALLELRIARPLWQQAWFLALIGVALLAAGYGVYRTRLTQMLAAERMRTRIATDLHDAVGADLSRISLIAESAERELQEEPALARETLSEVARSARDAVREMSDIVWALKRKRDDLAQVVHRLQDFAADVARPAGIEFRVEADLSLEQVRVDPESCRDLYLLLKEAIANAAKHAAARSIRLAIRPTAGGVSFELRDDGRGFDPSTRSKSRGGHGLAHMRERAGRLAADLEIESGSEGTTVRLQCMNMRPTESGKRGRFGS